VSAKTIDLAMGEARQYRGYSERGDHLGEAQPPVAHKDVDVLHTALDDTPVLRVAAPSAEDDGLVRPAPEDRAPMGHEVKKLNLERGQRRQ
jgi:hypothetical protein